jgi:hypothetical protein
MKERSVKGPLQITQIFLNDIDENNSINNEIKADKM